jgi:hypothetical protein
MKKKKGPTLCLLLLSGTIQTHTHTHTLEEDGRCLRIHLGVPEGGSLPPHAAGKASVSRSVFFVVYN